MNIKSIFKKENIMPVAVLCAICLVVAALMGAVNLVTAPIIKKAEEQKVYDSLRVVLDGEFEEVALPEGAPATAKGLYKVTDGGELKGHVVTVVAKGYAGEIAITVGVDAEGKITKAVVTKQSETHGKSGMSAYPDNFAGKGADDIDEVETFTGATISSTAIKKAITDALNTALGNANAEPEPEPEQLFRPEAEIETLAAALVGEGADLENVTPEGEKLDYVKRIYKDKGGKGYVAYMSVTSQYGTAETETLVHIGNNGKIVAVNKLVWKTSDAMYGYVPPEAPAVDAFYATFAGKTLAQFKDAYVKADENDEVEHVTNATNTTSNLVASILEAFEQIDALIKLDMPRAEDEVESLAAALVGEGADLENVTPEGEKFDFVKRIYKDKGGKGYVAYVVVISANYGTVETETLVHISNGGKIVGVNKLVWKTSDAMYGYVPPEASVVDAFYATFAGKTLTQFKDAYVKADENDQVEHVTNATNTTNNLVASILEAFEQIDALIKKDMPREESEVESLAAALVGEGADLKNVTPEGEEFSFVKRIYKDKGGKGYVAYVVVIFANYGTVETETLVHIGADGKIAGVDKLVWKTSDAIYGYVPPTQEAVDAFYATFAGKTLTQFKDAYVKTGEGDQVEHITNATNTTGNLITAMLEGFEEIDGMIKRDMPRAETEVEAAAGALAGATIENVTPTDADYDYVRRVYSDGNGGYVIYLVVISPNYGTPETETLIHLNNKGEIAGVNKLLWKTSDALWGYVPPTQEEVDAFYATFGGKNLDEFKAAYVKADENDEVEHVTNATSTTGRLIDSMLEAFEAAEALGYENNDFAARIVGIVALALAIAAPVAIVGYNFNKRRKR